MSARQSEFVSFPARLFNSLPAETRLHLRHSDFTEEIVMASVEIPTPCAVDGILFDGPEVGALAAGVDADRAWPSDLVRWATHKLEDPEHRITLEDVLAGATMTGARAFTVGDMLARLGLELVRIEIPEPAAATEHVAEAA